MLYLLMLRYPSQISVTMVGASNVTRFQFTPSSLRKGHIGLHGDTQYIKGNHNRKVNHHYPSPDTHLEVSSVSKRSYAELQCRGVYDASIISRLERVCKDCYNLYKDDEILGFCRYVNLWFGGFLKFYQFWFCNLITVVYILHRTDCFGSEIFRICLQSLLLNQESDQYLELVDMIGKRKKW